jgi:small-conductance mechanosensitive channel
MQCVRIILVLFAICGACPAIAQSTTAPATPAANASITPAEAERAIAVLQDDNQRAQLIETLRTIAKALPAQAHGKGSQGAKPGSPLPADGLGRQVLTQVSVWAEHMVAQLGSAVRAIADFPLLWRWIRHVGTDPSARTMIIGALWRLAAVLGAGIAAERLLAWSLGHPYRTLERRSPPITAALEESLDQESIDDAKPAGRFDRTWQALQRLPFAIAGLLLQLLPIAIFAVIATILAASAIIGATGNTRLVIMAVVDAYALLRGIMSVTRFFVSHDHPRLAVLHFRAETAAYIEIWIRRIAVTALFGVTLVEAAALLGLAAAAEASLLKLVALIVHLFLIIIVLQSRRGIAALLAAPEDEKGAVAALRNRFADVWHYIAIFLILGLWLVWAIQVRDGLSNLFRLLLVTVAVFAAARLISVIVLGALDRVFHLNSEVAARYPDLQSRANRYYPLLRGSISAVIWVVTAVALLEAWGIDALAWFAAGKPGDRLISASITIAVSAIVAIAVWESANAAMDRHVKKLVRGDQFARIARVKTLLPILRTSLFITLLVVLGLTILNQVGVNIAPLLAGAGIVGVAIGFGSQKLVQDLITGLFLLFENAMQVGDWVTAGGLSGSVENLSIRTVRLRAGDGSLHIIPFSSVTSVTNTNRGVGNAAVSVNVALKEDPDRVGDALKAIATEMRAEPNFAPMMQSDLQLWGVDKVDASAMTIVGQIVCTDAGRWGVQREFNRRLKLRFQELGIAIANPTQTILLEQRADATGEGKAPAGATPDADSTTVPQSPPPAALGHTE